MAITKLEREVTDLWERGFAMGKIAVQLGVKPQRVSRIITNFVGPNDEARVERGMMATGSAMLASAILEMRRS